MNRPAKVLFLVPYPLHRAPSQRFRVENFLPVLDQAGVYYQVRTFIDEATWQILYKQGGAIQKASGILKGFLRRWRSVLLEAPRYDYVFIHREAAPLGPPIFEWVLTKALGKKIIYDFDDAIWIPNTSKANSIADKIKCFWKVKYICKWSYKVVAGNAFLANFAQQTATNVVYLPTTVDMENSHNIVKQHTENTTPVFGWTGSHSTLKYLKPLASTLEKLAQEMAFRFVVIADKEPDFAIPNLAFVPWNAKTESADLSEIDIGVMPLEADNWSEGKCGFKLIQYLSLGIPALASPVGVNKTIIEPGINGFLCQTEEEWLVAMKKLANDFPLRKQMGVIGRNKMLSQFSIQSQSNTFLSLFS